MSVDLTLAEVAERSDREEGLREILRRVEGDLSPRGIERAKALRAMLAFVDVASELERADGPLPIPLDVAGEFCRRARALRGRP